MTAYGWRPIISKFRPEYGGTRGTTDRFTLGAVHQDPRLPYAVAFVPLKTAARCSTAFTAVVDWCSTR